MAGSSRVDATRVRIDITEQFSAVHRFVADRIWGPQRASEIGQLLPHRWSSAA